MRFERNLFLYNGKNLKKIIKKIICNNFKNFILNSDEDTRDNMKKFLAKNTKFYNFQIIMNFLMRNWMKIRKKTLTIFLIILLFYVILKKK